MEVQGSAGRYYMVKIIWRRVYGTWHIVYGIESDPCMVDTLWCALQWCRVYGLKGDIDAGQCRGYIVGCILLW